MSGRIALPPENRKDFFDELRSTLQDLFTRYPDAEGDPFTLAVAVHPKEERD